MDKTEQARLRKRRQRDKERDQNVTQSPESVTQGPTDVTQDVTQYPAILHMLVDPIKRRKLEKICQSLKERNLDKLVTMGYPGMGGVPFDMIGDLLEATE